MLNNEVIDIHISADIYINMQNSEKMKMFIKAHFPKYCLWEAVKGLIEINCILGFITHLF